MTIKEHLEIATRKAYADYIAEGQTEAERMDRARETSEYSASVARLIRLGLESVNEAIEQQQVGMN